MIKEIDGANERAIALEIINGYENNDEKSIEKLFEQKLASGITKINMLVKIDDMSISKSSWKAMCNDGIFAIKHMKNCGRIAIVGNSKFEEFLIKIDNAFFENKKAGRSEKYFHTSQLDIALGWINE
jgi:stage II sporulation SpoAA-like protein